MTRFGKWQLASFLVFVLAGPVSAADGFDDATRAAIQGVISHQLDAFSQNDPKSAESFAAPAIQSRFPEPAAFFEMVKRNYGALVKPKSTQFGEMTSSPHGPLQKMTIVAADGSVWTAVYALQQVDGHWRISGCGLMKVEGQQDI
jgi:hypothetical protein